MTKNAPRVANADQIAAALAHKQQIVAALATDNQLHQALLAATNLCLESLSNGGKLLLVGNGGSAGDCQHIAAELVGRYGFDRPGLPAIALTTDTSALTAISNDYGYPAVFSRQVEALGKPGDVLLGLSTSGNSVNVINALVAARQIGLGCIGLTGRGGGAMREHCDILIDIPAQETASIQEGHIMMGHILCDLIEKALFAKS